MCVHVTCVPVCDTCVLIRMKAVSRHKMRGGRGVNFFDWGFGLMFGYLLQTFVLGFPSLKILLRYSRLQQVMIESGVADREAQGLALM